ncbi:hypothetical protein INT45_010100 [Circinella minor]|uniref:Telomere length regulation protein conserved domain-containing protein n=1 Tax=Circinella minor TaxID=1195481 RepID=A0A8H7S879_9FUNG|nr:hypothetical protein INT45_010100 [Circinella minor]
MNEQLRIFDDATLPENKPNLDTIRTCLEQPYESTIRPLAWKHHVRNIIQTVIPNWSYAFNTNNNTLCLALYDTMLRVPKVTLPILLDCLSYSNATTLELYIDLLKRLTADPVPYGDDRFFCSLLCSVPTRIANALGVGAQESWYIDKNYFARLARQVARNINKLDYPGELLGKIIRLGHADVCITAIYPIILDQHGKGWSDIWATAESYSSSGKITETILRLVQKQHQEEESDNNNTYNIQKTATQLAIILFENDGDGKSATFRVESFLSYAYLRLANASWTNTNTLRIAMTTAIYALGQLQSGDNTVDCDKTSISSESLRVVNNLIHRLIDKWADPIFLKHGSYKEQQYITAGLVYAFGYLSTVQIENLMIETPLRGFIHRWFESADQVKMKLAVVVAETISELTEEGTSRLNFGILKQHEDKKYLDIKKLAEKRDALIKVKQSACDDYGPIIEQSSNPQSSDYEHEDDNEELDPDAILTGDQESDEEEEDNNDEFEPYPMEEESDDEVSDEKNNGTKARNKRRAKAPVYIQDLILYLKDDEDPVKLDIGLSTAEQLIRDKTNVGSELSDSATELAKRLIHITKAYDLDNTIERQKFSLGALIAAVPETVTGYMIDQIFDRNTSMEQKSMILASIILGVRELSGTTIDPKNEQDQLSLELEKKIVIEEGNIPTVSSKSAVIGKSRVFSRRMDIEKRKTTNRNRLSGIAGPVFFFPLLVGWWEGARGKARSWLGRDALLAERFVMTLLVIMHGATNTPDRSRIVTEYFEFALPLRFVKLPQAVTRSILLGFDIIVNINYYHQSGLLLQEYPQQLTETKNWLEGPLNQIR